MAPRMRAINHSIGERSLLTLFSHNVACHLPPFSSMTMTGNFFLFKRLLIVPCRADERAHERVEHAWLLLRPIVPSWKGLPLADGNCREGGVSLLQSEQKKTLMAKNFTKGFVLDRDLKAQSVALENVGPPLPLFSNLRKCDCELQWVKASYKRSCFTGRPGWK